MTPLGSSKGPTKKETLDQGKLEHIIMIETNNILSLVWKIHTFQLKVHSFQCRFFFVYMSLVMIFFFFQCALFVIIRSEEDFTFVWKWQSEQRRREGEWRRLLTIDRSIDRMALCDAVFYKTYVNLTYWFLRLTFCSCCSLFAIPSAVRHVAALKCIALVQQKQNAKLKGTSLRWFNSLSAADFSTALLT